MSYFKRTFMLTEEEKRKVGEMTGKIMQYILEGRSKVYMAEQLGLDIWQVERNIDETLYTLRKQVGRWRYLKLLFWK